MTDPTALLTQCYSGDQIEKKIFGTCSAHGEEEKGIQDFGRGNLRERDHLEEPGQNGRLIL